MRSSKEVIRDVGEEEEGVWGYIGLCGRGDEAISCDYIRGEGGV